MADRVSKALALLATGIETQVTADEPIDWAQVQVAANGILDSLPGLPPVKSADVEVAASREEVERLASRTKDVGADLERLAKQVQDAIVDIEKRIGDARTQEETRETDLRQRVDELAGVIDTQKTALSDALDKQQTAFRADQEQRRDEHTAALADLKKATDLAVNEFRAAATDEREKVEAHTTAHLEALKEILGEAKKVHGAIGRTAMASGYQVQAAQEEEAADRYRTLALRFGIASVVLVLIAVGFAAFGARAETLIAKAGAVVVLGALWRYTAVQSADHRTTARRLRNTYLAIASLSPYLSAMKDEGAREEVISSFAYIFFAAPQQADSPEETIHTVEAVMNWAKERKKSSPSE
jgi:hypothetical protein